MLDTPEEAKQKVIEMIEGSLLCETKERDTELATQIADEVIPIIREEERKRMGEWLDKTRVISKGNSIWWDKFIKLLKQGRDPSQEVK